MSTTETQNTENTVRSLRDIAIDIRANWPVIHPTARPYLQAMGELNKMTDKYGYDDAEDIVLRFLSNATTWKGPDARRIKAELRKMAGVK